MSTYNYKCLSCDKEFVISQSIKEKSISNCKFCDIGKVKKIINGDSGLIFKGKGFYLTDYRNNNNKSGSNFKSSENKSIKTTKSKE